MQLDMPCSPLPRCPPTRRKQWGGIWLKVDDKYRFSLQFKAETQDQIQVGELLERLGNRKSAVVVAALAEYMASRPELALESTKVNIQISRNQPVGQEVLEHMIREIVEERLAAFDRAGHDTAPKSASDANALQSDIAAMIGNLDVFEQF